MPIEPVRDDSCERTEYELTLKFKASSLGSLDCPSVERMLNWILSDWCEGRHPFDAEMITAGAARCLKQAMFKALEEQAQQEFGHELVTSEKSSIARWFLEAQERAKKMPAIYFNDPPKAELTVVSPE